LRQAALLCSCIIPTLSVFAFYHPFPAALQKQKIRFGLCRRRPPLPLTYPLSFAAADLLGRSLF
jgi:hypothetical protein